MRQFIKKPLFQFAFILLACSVYALILLPGGNNSFDGISSQFKNGFIVPVLIITALFAVSAVFSRKIPGLDLGILVGCLVFAFALRGTWVTHTTSSLLVGGFQPNTDASYYIQGALKFLFGEQMIGINATRPLFSVFLSVLLSLTSNNLQITTAVLTLLIAVSTIASAGVIRRTFGFITGTGFFILVFLFSRRTIGTVMTENLGLSLGLIGLALTISGAKAKNTRVLFAGYAAYIIGLLIRPSAMFILLTLPAGYILYQRSTLADKIKTGIGSLLILVSGFLVNSYLLKKIVVAGSVPFSSFIYSLYNLSQGGDYGWSIFIRDHPDVMALAEPLRTQTALKIFTGELLGNPLMFIKGVFYQYYAMFIPNSHGLFSFIFQDTVSLSVISMILLDILFILGLAVIIINRKKPEYLILGFVVVGVFLSIPFAPPTDAVFFRPYAVVIPVFSLLTALALQSAVNAGIDRLPVFKRLNPASPEPSPVFSYGVFGIVILVFLAAALFRGSYQKQAYLYPDCDPGDEPVIMINQYPAVNVRGDADTGALVDIYYEDYYRILRNLNTFQREAFARVDINRSLWSGMNLDTGEMTYIIMKTKAVTQETRLVTAYCGQYQNIEQSGYPYRYFFAASQHPAQ